VSVFEDLVEEMVEIEKKLPSITILIKPEAYEKLKSEMKERSDMSKGIDDGLEFIKSLEDLVIVTEWIDESWVILPYSKRDLMNAGSIWTTRYPMSFLSDLD